jgi:hypothetical protein
MSRGAFLHTSYDFVVTFFLWSIILLLWGLLFRHKAQREDLSMSVEGDDDWSTALKVMLTFSVSIVAVPYPPSGIEYVFAIFTWFIVSAPLCNYLLKRLTNRGGRIHLFASALIASLAWVAAAIAFRFAWVCFRTIAYG